jgi:hypothetical protein
MFKAAMILQAISRMRGAIRKYNWQKGQRSHDKRLQHSRVMARAIAEIKRRNIRDLMGDAERTKQAAVTTIQRQVRRRAMARAAKDEAFRWLTPQQQLRHKREQAQRRRQNKQKQHEMGVLLDLEARIDLLATARRE